MSSSSPNPITYPPPPHQEKDANTIVTSHSPDLHLDTEGSSPNPDIAHPPLEDPENAKLSVKGLTALCLLRFSSAWGERSSAFAIYLFLITIFPSTLVPASAFGFCTTASGILLSSWSGSFVDRFHRLKVVRAATAIQKVSTAVMYGLLLVLILVGAPARKRGVEQKGSLVILCMTGIVAAGCVVKVSTVCLTVSVEREWPSVVSHGSSTKLTTMNTWLRRTDLVCDLVSPLFVSALSAGVGAAFSVAFLTGMTVVCFALEMFLSGLAYRQFPELRAQSAVATGNPTGEEEDTPPSSPRSLPNPLQLLVQLRKGCAAFIRDLLEFSNLPVFYTSLSIASIYLTVLSFDGTMLTYLKNTLSYSDPFLAGQRAACTAAGLLGTILFPVVLQRIGLVRTGSWSISFELACLIPVAIALQLVKTTTPISPPALDVPVTHSIPPWLATSLFGGMALSRIGLWMFDLSQLQILQESLESHPRRNRLTSIQYTLQNTFDMAKYALTIGLAKPSQFRWAGLVSLVAVFVGCLLYTLGYARRVRGHIGPHWVWLDKLKMG